MNVTKEVPADTTITDEFIINLAVAHSNHKETSSTGIEYEVISHERLISFSRALLFAVELATPIARKGADKGLTGLYQDRVAAAHHALFHDDPTDVPERLARFMEEANETCQAFGMSREDAHRLVDYTYDRPAGEPVKEIGAAMLTLTSLCVVAGFDLMSCAEADLEKLQRPETIDRIRAKRSTRHGRGPLPGFDPSSALQVHLDVEDEIAKIDARFGEINKVIGDAPREDWMRPLEEEFAFLRGRLSILSVDHQAGLELVKAARDVLAERDRQKSIEGWSTAHDDEHVGHELSRAAASYAIGNIAYWPWSLAWWKPSDRRRNLVKAGALIIAEIERIDRAVPATAEATPGAVDV